MEGREDRIIILGCMCRPWRGDPSMLRGEGFGAARNADRCCGQRDCSGVRLEHHCKAGYWLLLKQPKQVVECDAEDGTSWFRRCVASTDATYKRVYH